MIGGFEEATITELGHERLFLLHRKGFIKYALRHGYSVAPVYLFGENDLYWNAQIGMSFRLWISSGALQIPGVLPWGQSFLPWLPRRLENYKVICGKPMKLPHLKHPTQHEVDVYHARYVASLADLFNRFKLDKNRQLNVA
jgi:2-acylglycerol O-acyltransferase 2